MTAEQTMDAFSSLTSLKRSGNPLEVGKASAFLISDDASYITATSLTVDGGYLACGRSI